MLSTATLALLAGTWLVSLFLVAQFGERWSQTVHWQKWHRWIYTLAIGVYCTTWTFFGAVGQLSSTGWWFPPTYLGAIITLIFGWRLVRKLILVSKTQNISSLADLLAARFGHSQAVAITVTMIALVGIIPYIALQLKGISVSFQILNAQTIDSVSWWQDSTFLIAIIMTIFLWLFGMKHYAATDKQPGMIAAVAFESLFKLFALTIAAIAAYIALSKTPNSLSELTIQSIAQTPEMPHSITAYLTQTLLGCIAIICLPRQFHVMVIENDSDKDLTHAKKYFSLYLILLGILLIPLIVAGKTLLPTATLPDHYVLNLALSEQSTITGAIVFLGSLAAGTSMLIVATIAMMTMISHTFLTPLALRLSLQRREGSYQRVMQWLQRAVILVIVLAAYAYYLWLAKHETLAQIGLISMVAVAQFSPSLIAALYWKTGNRFGAITGLTLGGLMWGLTLVFPALVQENILSHDNHLVAQLLRLSDMLRLAPWWDVDAMTAGTLSSLIVNTVALITVSLATQQTIQERTQALRFYAPELWQEQLRHRTIPSDIAIDKLVQLLSRFIVKDRLDALIAKECERLDISKPPLHADPNWAEFFRRELTGVVGSASAQLLINAHVYGANMQHSEILTLVDEATEVLQFNHHLLLSTLNTLNQGVVVIDRNLRLVAWNPRYAELFALPPELLQIGQPVDAILKHNATHYYPDTNSEDFVEKRLQHLQSGTSHYVVRELTSGMVLEIHGSPLPGGGYVTSYSDITQHKNLSNALQKINETLEFRVQARTKELALANAEANEAKHAAEQANASKTKFLAAASHDLVQPLNAAQLFAGALKNLTTDPQQRQLIEQLIQSLTNSEELLKTLLEISKFDAGVVSLEMESVSVAQVFNSLEGEFHEIARHKQLHFSARHHDQWVYGDKKLIKRILRNLLSNAVRYTDDGGVLLAARSHKGSVIFQVWDTGHGIEEHAQQIIFEEFKRNINPAKPVQAGYGLGLAIVKRMAKALATEVKVQSRIGKGSVFSFSMERAAPVSFVQAKNEPFVDAHTPLAGMTILCLDNDANLLTALSALLSGWGCEVYSCKTRQEFQRLAQLDIDLCILDYQLDHGDTGISVWKSLPNPRPPALVISALRDASLKDECEEAGTALLHKPVKPLALRGVLQNYYKTIFNG